MPDSIGKALSFRGEGGHVLKITVEFGNRLIVNWSRGRYIKPYRSILKITRYPIPPLDLDSRIFRQITQKSLNFASNINNLAERRAFSTFI